MASQKGQLERDLVQAIRDLGFPGEFGMVIAQSLGTESTMLRMIRYLRAARPTDEDEIADEMLAIISDRDTWTERKKSEYYNNKFSEYLRFGREEDE